MTIPFGPGLTTPGGKFATAGGNGGGNVIAGSGSGSITIGATSARIDIDDNKIEPNTRTAKTRFFIKHPQHLIAMVYGTWYLIK
jgi:hypothetical protein